MPNKTQTLTTIGSALDEISWDWLNDNHPRLAEAIETEVARGATPDAIRRYVVQRTQRIEQAAAHVVAGAA